MSESFWKKLSYVAGLAIVGALFGLLAFLTHIEIKDTDLWLHIGSGRYIFQNLQVPKIDIFSCTISGTPWVNHEWLFQVVVYTIYQLTGTDGLIDFQSLIVFINFLLLFFLGYNKEKQFMPLLFLFLILNVYELRFTLRPDVFSLLFFTLDVFILSVHLEKRWSVAALVIIQILWSNMHGFFILGPLLILIAFFGEMVKRRIPLPFEWNHVGRLSDEEYKRLKFVLKLVWLACLINPYGLRGVLYPIRILFSVSGENRIFFDYIQELARPFTLNSFLVPGTYDSFKLLIIFSALSFVLNFRRLDIGGLILWTLLLIFSLSAIRNMVFFALVAYFAFLSNAQFLSLERIFPIPALSKRLSYVCSIALKSFFFFFLMNYFIQAFYRGYFDFDKMERKSEFGGVSLRNFPYKAVDFLEQNSISGNFFNDFNSGAYLVGRVSPAIKVFIDGRTEVYGARFFDVSRRVWAGDEDLFDLLIKQDHLTGAFLNSVYVPAPERFIRRLYEDKTWVLVYFDYDATIFLKDIPQNKKWIDRYRIDLTQWSTKKMDLVKLGAMVVPPYQYLHRGYVLFHVGLLQKAIDEVEEALRIAPNSAEGYKLLGRIYLAKNEYKKAYENLRTSKLIDASDAQTRYYLAVSLSQLGELKRAYEQCDYVLSGNPKNPRALFLLAEIYAKQKKYEASLNTLKQAHESAPKAVGPIIRIGDIFLKDKEYSKAREVFSLGLTTKKNLDKVHGKIAMCYELLAEGELAQKELESAQRAASSKTDLKRVLDDIDSFDKTDEARANR